MLDGALRMVPGLCEPPRQPQPPPGHGERGHERIKTKRHDQRAVCLALIQPQGLCLVCRGAGATTRIRGCVPEVMALQCLLNCLY